MIDANMKRSPLITIVNVLQSFLGLVLAGLTVYLLALTRSPETLVDPDSAGTVRGLLIGAVVLGIPALVTLIGVLGLWKLRFWGWVLSLATDVGTLAVLVYSMIDEGIRDGNEIALGAGFIVSAALLLQPAVRKLFWNAGTNTNLSS